MNAVQLSLEEGLRRRDDALTRVEQHASPDWNEQAFDTVCSVARRLRFFAADDLWEAGLPTPREPRAIGPVLLRAVRAGFCWNTHTQRNSRKVSQNARPITIYESRIYGG